MNHRKTAVIEEVAAREGEVALGVLWFFFEGVDVYLRSVTLTLR